MSTARRLVMHSVLAIALLPWLGVTALLIVGRGHAEAWLADRFGASAHHDAFEHMDQVLGSLWAVQSLHALLAVSAVVRRRGDVLTVLLIGPTIALAGCAASQDWSDPNWFLVEGVCAIGCLVGGVVGAGYWLVKWRRLPGPRRLAREPGRAKLRDERGRGEPTVTGGP